jgi:hypothetical protein
MNMFGWLTSHFSARGKALAMYRRGMAKANKRDHRGAIEDYTAALKMSAPPDVVAMVRYNRGLVYVAAGDQHQGAEDLEAVLAMEEPLTQIKAMAKQKLARMEARSHKHEKHDDEDG